MSLTGCRLRKDASSIGWSATELCATELWPAANGPATAIITSASLQTSGTLSLDYLEKVCGWVSESAPARRRTG